MNEQCFYLIITATAGDGHSSEIPPVHAVLKTSFCSNDINTNVVWMT